MLDVVIDIVTTGLGRRRPEAIIEVGLAWRSTRGRVRTIGWLCNPGEYYFNRGRGDRALELNDLSKEKILSAPTHESVSHEVRHFIQNLKEQYGGVQLFAYNIELKKSYLIHEPFNLNYSYGPCIMERACQRWNKGGKYLRLAEAIVYFEDPIPEEIVTGLHSAQKEAHLALLLHEVLD